MRAGRLRVLDSPPSHAGRETLNITTLPTIPDSPPSQPGRETVNITTLPTIPDSSPSQPGRETVNISSLSTIRNRLQFRLSDKPGNDADTEEEGQYQRVISDEGWTDIHLDGVAAKKLEEKLGQTEIPVKRRGQKVCLRGLE
ncbi:hypothetical protein Pmani_026143 [Petrolisthes manimaculis]|uniref:Uncharacterized protein n=1 Tax=Petrolisthes manimaculis TaxID=1843537 RepID=A0AAE1TY44_9EUCA|nr:hypothetical protein Pmani_026143 [Petrolisthes manimaculis]